MDYIKGNKARNIGFDAKDDDHIDEDAAFHAACVFGNYITEESHPYLHTLWDRHSDSFDHFSNTSIRVIAITMMRDLSRRGRLPETVTAECVVEYLSHRATWYEPEEWDEIDFSESFSVNDRHFVDDVIYWMCNEPVEVLEADYYY